MTTQTTENIGLGEIKVSKNRSTIFTIPNLGSSMALVLYDPVTRVGGVAHIVLPESSLDSNGNSDLPGKFADQAVPELVKQFMELGGQSRLATISLVGGAQMFNFGGGGGNLLNIGTRNATAIRAALSKNNLAIEKADIGGNKGKSLKFVLATGEVIVSILGDREYIL